MKINKTSDEWKKVLDPETYRVTREGGTEMPFTGELLHNKETGRYVCSNCGQELFSSDAKFDSGTGWPSFDRAIPGAVEFHDDTSLGMKRTEVICSRCDAHLGHLFPDGPTDLPDGRQGTGKRFCINSCALNFEEK